MLKSDDINSKKMLPKSQEIFETIFLCLPVKGVLCDWPRITLLYTTQSFKKRKLCEAMELLIGILTAHHLHFDIF